MRVNIGMPVVRTDGRTVSRRSLGHMITKFSRMGRFIYRWSSGGALHAQSSAIIISPLTCIINLSITSVIVPKQLKIARVIPLLKSGEQDIFTNYRPVTVLPAFSKILERIMYNHLLRFLNNHNILSDNQYGFRKHHSTAYALACLYDKISSTIENKECAVGIFIDSPKAFTTGSNPVKSM